MSSWFLTKTAADGHGLPRTCDTCVHSRFLAANLHACTAHDDEEVDEDDGCCDWEPMVVIGGGGRRQLFGAMSGDDT